MFRSTTILLAAGALALSSTAMGAATATVTVQIKATGFSPSTLTINHGDRVTWHNADTVDHQVVADSGAFASPILHRGESWTVALNVAGTFKYHDALYPRRTGKVTVKGPPPSVTLALSQPIVTYGTPVTISGAISTGAVGPVGRDRRAAVRAGVACPARDREDRNRRRYSYSLQPAIYTTYVARWGNVASGSVVVQVAPAMHLLPGENGYMRATISSPVSLWHKHVYLQRLSSLGQWVNIVALDLGSQNGRIFQPAAYLPKGVSHIRVFLSVNQAGNGLLAAHSGTQTIRRVH